MVLLAGAMRVVKRNSCSPNHKFARTSRRKGSESLSWGVAVLLAQDFCFFKQKKGSPSGSKQEKADVLLTTVMGSLPWHQE